MTDSPVTVHYHRPLGDYDGWELWLWNTANQRSRVVPAEGRDEFGLVFSFLPDLPFSRMGLLPRKGQWEDKDPPDRVWSKALGHEVWLVSGRGRLDRERPDTSPFVVGAWLDEPAVIQVRLSTPIPPGEIEPSRFSLLRRSSRSAPPSVIQVRPGIDAGVRTGQGFLEVELTIERRLDLLEKETWELQVGAAGYRPARLLPRRILDGPEYTSDAEMGAVVSDASTHFRVFAPTATRLTVNLYRGPRGGTAERHEMVRTTRGLWELTIPGDLAGLYYTLSADGFDSRFHPDREIVDPYSRCNTAHDGRTLLFRDRTPVADRPQFPPAEAVIYELHVRDFTISPDSGVAMKGRFLGLTEPGTHLPDDALVVTGLDHLAELGINTVQILPIQDFENDETSSRYDWGYMPVHFNSPDGWYASDVTGTARVVEAKKMIDALHRRGIRVVLDVVYNHTAELPPEKIYSFEGLVPGYYYRLRPDGTQWDGSGTGNEFRTEAPMARKLVLDSLRYWVTEYKVDGFRFDLMGLIDRETLTRAVRELHALDPHLLLYGEPWTGGPTPIPVMGKGAQRGLGYAVFNDDFRDAVKGPVFGIGPGYIQDGHDSWRVRRGLKGSIDDFAQEPVEAVNYVECHDNHTLWDRIVLSTRSRETLSHEDRVRMDLLAAAAVLLAQGIPFLQAGQEMLRSKKGLHNTWNRPDSVNQIVWQWKKERAAVVAWYREMIAIRRGHPMFRLASAGEVRSRFRWLDSDLGIPLPEAVCAFHLARLGLADSWEEAVAIFHPGAGPVEVGLPAGPWLLFARGERASSREPLAADPVHDRIAVPARSAVLLARPAGA